MSDEKSIDLLVVTQFFPPESMGGAHRWEKISMNLNSSVNPHIVCTFPTYPFGEFNRRWRPVEQDVINDIPVTRLFTYQPTTDSTVGRILNYGIFALLSSIYMMITFWRYDCIVTVSTPHTTFFPGLVGKLTGRKWIIDVFDLWIDNAADLGYVNQESILYQIVRWLECISFNRADKIFVITETMEEIYQGKYDHLDLDFNIVPFGVDTEAFHPTEVPASTDVIYTGNLGTGQAMVPFIKGFSDAGENLDLTIVGDGERREELESFVNQLGISDQVRFEGYVDRDEIPEMIADAKISLVPLKTEYQLDYARPTKLLETMAVGTPYIGSKTGELDTLANKSNSGVVVNNQPEEVTEALDHLLSSSELRQRKGNNAMEFVKHNHRWEIIGREVSDVIEEIT
jgi:glycosyltransferase involved in cell wall biosynthesis